MGATVADGSAGAGVLIKGRQWAAATSTPAYRVWCCLGGGTALANLANRASASISRAYVPSGHLCGDTPIIADPIIANYC